MGSYSAPAFAVGYHKVTNDLETALDSVMIGPLVCADFLITFRPSIGYDGGMSLELQLEDDTWLFVYGDTNPDGTTNSSPADIHTVTGYNADIKYPYHVRVVNSGVPTLGTGVAYLVTVPGPANPLF